MCEIFVECSEKNMNIGLHLTISTILISTLKTVKHIDINFPSLFTFENSHLNIVQCPCREFRSNLNI